MYFKSFIAARFFYTLLTVSLSSFANAHAQTTSLDVLVLYVGETRVQAEVADSPDTRATGLMYRRSLPADYGMLFVFEQSGMPCFWMKNTPLSLDIAFIDHKGVISNIEAMQAYELKSHCPTTPVRYALEMEQGWFKKNGQQAGDKVTGLP